MKTVVFLGNTCNYSFIYHKYSMEFLEYETYSIVDYHGIDRDFPSWFEKDFYKTRKVIFVNVKNKLSYIFFFSKFLKQIGRENISFHCFGLQSCILPLLFRVDFIYHGYGDILSTPFFENYKFKTWLRVLLSKLSLKYCRYIIVSQSTDIPYLESFNVNRNKIRYIPLISDGSNQSVIVLNSEISSLFDDNKIIFVPTRNTEIKQLDILIEALINIFEKNPCLFHEKKIKIVFIKWGNLWEENKVKFQKSKIREYVNWIDLQSQVNLLELIRKSYLIINEFTDPVKYPGFIGGITREAMSLGKPVISHYSFVYDHLFHKTRPPLIEFENNVICLEVVLDRTLKLNDDELLRFGERLKIWYDHEYQRYDLIFKTIKLHFD